MKIFSPEHGLSGRNEGKVPHTRDSLTGLPVYSLYGNILKPSEKMLGGLDALAFDIQDMGARFYTYITTLGYTMEAAAKKGILFYVLDRPNPITGSAVQGPIMEKNFKSFTGYFPLPIRHGMTVGELAEMFNTENRIGARLHVIKMAGYDRTIWYDQTGLPWVNPSPNLRTLTRGILYPGVAMVEGTNVSVGRGTATPFELVEVEEALYLRICGGQNLEAAVQQEAVDAIGAHAPPDLRLRLEHAHGHAERLKLQGTRERPRRPRPRSLRALRRRAQT